MKCQHHVMLLPVWLVIYIAIQALTAWILRISITHLMLISPMVTPLTILYIVHLASLIKITILCDIIICIMHDHVQDKFINFSVQTSESALFSLSAE